METDGSSSSAGAAPASLEFRLLGPLEVRDGREPVSLGGGRPRALLALLLVRRGEAVSTDRIVDDLWGESPPPSARHMVEVYVSDLRKALGKDRILRASGGYRVRLEPDELDSARFERLAAEGGELLAAGEAERASARLGEALELWRGQALADFAYEPFAEVESRRLEELHLQAEEEWVDAQLALGNAAGLVPRLEEQVARAPLRERRQGQLMLALAAAGRQAEALATYRSARRLLVSELGLEPSAELRRIERRILTQADGEAAEEGARELEERLTRRLVTVLSADLADGGHGADPEVARAEAERALEPAQRALEAHGGTVRELGDGSLLALFGIPVTHEDDAIRALRAAIELREAGLVARAGVDTGLALAGAKEVSGDILRTAAQLRDAAAAGEVVVGEQTRILARSAARLEPRWDERLAAWRLVEVPAVGARTRPWTPMVGREAELLQLLEAFERAVETERVQRVTVVGEAGIGKSRLGQELADRVRDRADVLVGRCLAYGEAITFWPLRNVVREAGGGSFEAIRGLLGDVPNADAIARRVAGAVGLLDTVHPIEEVRWAVRRLLEALAAKRPLVIGFDDLYWAEPAFLDLVDHLTAATQARILLVCLTRPDLLEERPAWARPRPSAELLMLGPLSRNESSQLLGGLELPGPELQQTDRRRIVAAAEGNPLFLEQLAAFAAERLASDDGDSALPTSLRTLLAARLDRLSPGEKTVVECAAVAGRTFWLDAVRDLLPAGSVSGLGRNLDALVRRDLLEPRRTSVPFMRAFRFRHSLIQDVAYHSVPKQRRAEAHERMAAWIEHAPRAAVGSKDRRIGHHLELASRYRAELGSDDPESAALAARAAGFLALAASRASTRGNPRAAASLLRRACGLLPRGDPQRRALLPQLGVELSESGDPIAAESALAEAIDDAVAASDRRVELRARLELAAIHGFTAPRTAAVEIAAIAEEAIPVFEQARDDAALARVWHVLGYVDVWAVRWDAGAAAFERALGHAREAGDAPEEASLVRWLARSILFGSTPAPDGIERCERLLSDLQGRRDAEAGVLEALASLQAMRGRFDDARDLYVRGGRTYAELGQNGRLARLTAVGTRIELLAGDRGAAERELRAAYEIYESRGDRPAVAAVAASLARLTSAEGRDEEAEELARVAAEAASAGDVTTQVRRRAAQARILARRGELGEAEALAREAVSLTEGTEFPDWQADTLLDLAEVLQAAGRQEEAGAAARDALRLYEAKGNLASAESVRALLGAPS